MTSLEKLTNSGNWGKVQNISFRFTANELEIAVPKKALHISGNQFHIDFKWTDNIEPGNPMLWLDQGDTAPNARFKYRYQKK